MKYLFLLFLIFISVLLINAIIKKSTAEKLTKRTQYKTDEETLAYAEKLKKMIDCKTISVNNEFNAFEFDKLNALMQELFPTVHKTAEKMTFSNDCWLYKIKGKDATRNIMLMSHHDVVAAVGEWKHPPFSAEIADGALWGRGTLDTKTPLFAEFSALEELLNEGFIPETNVYIASSHNEEIAGDGIPCVLKYFEKENITFETILDEGGAIVDPVLGGMKCKCAMVAVHEKGRHKIICTANEGTSHIGLSANTNTPVARMSSFINEINSKNIFIRRLYPEVKKMFSDLCPYTPFFMTILFSNLWFFEKILKILIPKINAQAGAMLGTTCSFNDIISSTENKNCVSKAMLRCVNDEDLKKDLEKIKKIAKKYDIEIKDADDNEYHKPADMSHPAFFYTKKCIAEIFPDVASAAYILPAGTDARHFSDICPCVIRFAPIEINSEQFKTIHSENENITLSAISDAVIFYKHYIKNYK